MTIFRTFVIVQLALFMLSSSWTSYRTMTKHGRTHPGRFCASMGAPLFATIVLFIEFLLVVFVVA